MKKYGLLLLCVLSSALRSAAPIKNIFSHIKDREYTGKWSADFKKQEKERLLNSEGLEKSTIPISIQDATTHNKLVAIISEPYPFNPPFSTFLSLQPRSLYEQETDPSNNMTYLKMNIAAAQNISRDHPAPLQYINQITGLNTVPLYVAMGGFRGSIALVPLDSAPPTHKAMIQNSIKALQLQNTDIQEIFPEDIKNYPHVHTIILSESTPEELRINNSLRNPNIQFQYTSRLKTAPELLANSYNQ